LKTFTRRFFLKNVIITSFFMPFVKACKNVAHRIIFQLVGANFGLGHRLLLQNFPNPTEEKKVKILVIGGGITGLSACRALVKKGENDFLLLELEEKIGGNAANGQNEYGKFPLGAHYLPLPNLHDAELIDFLVEAGIIKGFDEKKAPIYEETYLTFAPHERLFIKDKWQEGLIPTYGVSEANANQIRLFFKQMNDLKLEKGSDGLFLFDIPIKNTSKDKRYHEWDKITMSEWLSEQAYDAPELLEHLNYSCLDDFGIGIKNVSAWAAIHYFTARKNLDDSVFTWREGNSFLVEKLRKYVENRVLQAHLAYKIKIENEKVSVSVYDAKRAVSMLISAEKVIVATPQFVAQRLLPDRAINLKQFHYAPWLVATLTLSEMPSSSSYQMCWDNVIFGGKGLGYINVQHQTLAQKHQKFILTYYAAFDGEDATALRRQVYQNKEADWRDFILEDLQRAHPNITDLIEKIEYQVWGHGMISPRPDFIFGEALQNARKSLENRVFFAHSDLAGMSLFEEAFHQGNDIVTIL
jgi:protoporphyrinogen oxidase